jgi:hypothetical protein
LFSLSGAPFFSITQAMPLLYTRIINSLLRIFTNYPAAIKALHYIIVYLLLFILVQWEMITLLYLHYYLMIIYFFKENLHVKKTYYKNNSNVRNSGDKVKSKYNFWKE